MKEKEIRRIIRRQRAFYDAGGTRSVKRRKRALQFLRAALREMEGEIAAALKKDLGKSASESYMCETGLAMSEITWMLRHIDRLAAEHRVPTPITQYVARSYQKPSPYGEVLIMSPWNYPVLLSIDPLCAAVAAGNTVVLKPSAYAPASSAVLKKLIGKVFPPEWVCVVTGGRSENEALLDQKWDYIFFTGSQSVGRQVLAKAAPNLTPATLELGGKSPCIVDETADIALAAKRIVWGKFLNCGQTCVAPDYILCRPEVKSRLIRELQKQIHLQFGAQPCLNQNYGKMINEKHFLRVCGLIDPGKIVIGGQTDAASLQIEPTVLDGVTWDDAVMQEEIFGPVLPILTYEDIRDLPQIVNGRAKPLALYIFSGNKKHIRYITEYCQFGGGCVNDCVIHLATSAMPFGGVGESGMGGYHGKASFETFTHQKSIVDKKTWIDIPMRYMPWWKSCMPLVRMFLR